MQDQQNHQPPPQEVQEKLDLINKAQEASLLMSILCDKLGLQASKTTPENFIRVFSDLMKQKRDAQNFMEQFFITSEEVKLPKKRKRKEDQEQNA